MAVVVGHSLQRQFRVEKACVNSLHTKAWVQVRLPLLLEKCLETGSFSLPLSCCCVLILSKYSRHYECEMDMKNLLGRCYLREESAKRMVRTGNPSLRNLIIYWVWGSLMISVFQIAWGMERTAANGEQLPGRAVHKRKIKLWKVKFNWFNTCWFWGLAKPCRQDCPQWETGWLRRRVSVRDRELVFGQGHSVE